MPGSQNEPRRLLAIALGALALVAGCHRDATVVPVEAAPPDDPVADAAPAPTASTDSPFTPAPKPTASWASAVEARWSKVDPSRRDPALIESAELLRVHFGAPLGPKIAMQDLELPEHRRALLLQRDSGDLASIVLVVDRAGHLLWAREHAIAGIVPKVTHVALAQGPSGGVAIFIYDPPTGMVAARMWDGEGGLLADLEVLETPSCDALSALYWPGRGWIAVAADRGVGRAQLLGENGGRLWGHEGITVGTPWRAATPFALARDTDDTVMLFAHGPKPGEPEKTSPDHLLVTRLGADGRAAWSEPLDLGPAPKGTARAERLRLDRPGEGVVRAMLGSGPGHAFDVMSNREVARR